MEGISYDVTALPTSTITLFVFFGANFVLLGYLKYLEFTKGHLEEIDKSLHSKQIPVLKFTRQSITKLSQEIGVLGIICLYCWICENRPYFAHSGKEHLPDFFWFICFVILMFAFGSVHYDPKSNDLINRDQTEEWKGWMQTVFLLYHYFHASEVYNSVRVMISCYVWMTGFGNFSFFYIKGDFGFVRFAQMMWRLNFTVIFLCLVMNNMYMLYYICPLHTFYFLVVFATMRVRKEINHSKYAIRVKVAIVGALIFLVWEFHQLFDLSFFFLSSTPHPGAAVGAYGILYEWHFRSGLDHYSTFFGMIFALNFPQNTLWIQKVEALPTAQHFLVKASTGAVLLAASIWWATSIFPLPKLEFNQVHPYTFIIPLITYIYFRNITPYLRKVHLGVLASIGKYTLETYLMQHHIWLTSNAKTLLVLVPNYPKINLVFVTGLYFLIAQRLFRVTMVTRAMLIPDNPSLAMKWLGILSFGIGCFGIFGWFVQLINCGWTVLTIITIFIGVGFVALVDDKMKKYNKTSSSAIDENVNAAQPRGFLIAGLLFAIFSLAILPSLNEVGAPVNGGPLRPKPGSMSQADCLKHLHSGNWVDPQHEFCKSTSDPVCVGERWVWNNMAATQACKYSHFDSKKAQALLEDRSITFIGGDELYWIALEAHSIIDPKVGHAIPHGLQPGKKVSFQSTLAADGKMATVSFIYAPKSSDVLKVVKNGNMDTDLLVFGSFLGEALGGFNSENARSNWNNIATKISSTPCFVITPAAVDETKAASVFTKVTLTNSLASEYLDSMSPLVSKCDFSLDMKSITSGHEGETINGIIYPPQMYNVPSQLVYNAFQMVSPPPPKPAKAAGGKGKGGGVAQNPLLGFFTIALAASMLITMDNNGGIAFFFQKLFAPYSTAVTWEESTSELHKKIGVNAKPDYEPVETSDDIEKEMDIKNKENNNQDVVSPK